MVFSSAFLLGLALTSGAAAQDVNISIPSSLPNRTLGPDVYGYSIEPIWLNAYINNTFASTLLGHIKDVTGKAPPIRVGGNTADQTYIHDTLPTGNSSLPLPSLPNVTQFNITPEWYTTWSDYFPEGTDLIYTLNFNNNASAWADGVAQAQAGRTIRACSACGGLWLSWQQQQLSGLRVSSVRGWERVNRGGGGSREEMQVEEVRGLSSGN